MSDYVLPYNAISKSFSYSEAIVEFDGCVNINSTVLAILAISSISVYLLILGG